MQGTTILRSHATHFCRYCTPGRPRCGIGSRFVSLLQSTKHCGHPPRRVSMSTHCIDWEGTAWGLARLGPRGSQVQGSCERLGSGMPHRPARTVKCVCAQYIYIPSQPRRRRACVSGVECVHSEHLHPGRNRGAPRLTRSGTRVLDWQL